MRVCAIMLQEIAIQIRWNTKQLTKEFYKQNLVIRHVTRPCLCMTTSIIIKITRVISMWTPHWITVSCHGLEGPMTTGYYCAIFLFCGGGKKMTTKKQGILWLGYHRYPSKNPAAYFRGGSRNPHLGSTTNRIWVRSPDV